MPKQYLFPYCQNLGNKELWLNNDIWSKTEESALILKLAVDILMFPEY